MTAVGNAKQWLGNLATSAKTEITAWFQFGAECCWCALVVLRFDYPAIFFLCLALIADMIGYGTILAWEKLVDAPFLEPRRKEKRRQALHEREEQRWEQRREQRRQRRQQEWNRFLDSACPFRTRTPVDLRRGPQARQWCMDKKKIET